MKYDGFYHVSLQQIQIFLKCYEIRKFSRVAFEYNYTPSMISKTIRQMEIILGYELFVREHHLLKPTAAADVLAREWREFDSMITRGLDRAYAVHHTMGLTVKMSVAGDSLFLAEYVISKLEEFGGRELFRKIDWERRDMQALPKLLEDGGTDIIVSINRYNKLSGINAFQTVQLYKTADAVFIPRDFDIFYAKEPDFHDLEEYPFIILNPNKYPSNYELLMAVAEKYDFVPKIAVSCDNTESARDNLHLGRGLYLANSLTTSGWEDQDTRRVELGPDFCSEAVAAWRRDNENPYIKQIIDCLMR